MTDLVLLLITVYFNSPCKYCIWSSLLMVKFLSNNLLGLKRKGKVLFRSCANQTLCTSVLWKNKRTFYQKCIFVLRTHVCTQFSLNSGLRVALRSDSVCYGLIRLNVTSPPTSPVRAVRAGIHQVEGAV